MKNNYREALWADDTKCKDCINSRPPKWLGRKLRCKSPETGIISKVNKDMTCDYATRSK